MLKTMLDRLLDRLGLRRVERRRYTLQGELVEQLRAQAADARLPPEQLAATLLADGLALHEMAQGAWKYWNTLSEREKQVTALICLGYTNRQIAAILVLSPMTIKSHVRNILFKFDLHGKDDLRVMLANWDFSAWEP